MKYSLIFFAVLLVGCSKVNSVKETPSASPTTSITPISFSKTFTGSVDKYPIRMELSRNGSELSGKYVYTRNNREFSLKGTVDAQENLVLNEFDGAGNQTGMFKGRFESSSQVQGTWTKPNGSNELAFSLNENSSPFGAPAAVQSLSATDEEIATIAMEDGLEGTSVEAYVQVYKFLQPYFAECGDSFYYTEAKQGQYGQLQGYSIDLRADSVTQADYLNGIEWKGRAKILSSLHRYSNTVRGGWDKWQDGTPMNLDIIAINVKKMNGRWSIDPGYFLHRPLTCSQVPK